MTRQLNRLNARKVATLVELGRHADGGGLYLSISKDGRRRWVFLYRQQGKLREMGFGTPKDVTLARAREKAAQARAHIAAGRDPLEARRAERSIKTFGELADEFIYRDDAHTMAQ